MSKDIIIYILNICENINLVYKFALTCKTYYEIIHNKNYLLNYIRKCHKLYFPIDYKTYTTLSIFKCVNTKDIRKYISYIKFCEIIVKHGRIYSNKAIGIYIEIKPFILVGKSYHFRYYKYDFNTSTINVRNKTNKHANIEYINSNKLISLKSLYVLQNE